MAGSHEYVMTMTHLRKWNEDLSDKRWERVKELANQHSFQHMSDEFADTMQEIVRSVKEGE